MSAVHISPFSGTWYPGDTRELEELLEHLLEESRRRTGPYLYPGGLGFVVPHAGPQYSGAVAAAAYRSLRRQKPERIVLLAFPHRGGLRGVAVPRVATIETPLGAVPIDGALPSEFPRVAEDRVCDHSFEIQLPFLQKAAPSARIAPLYVGRMEEAERCAVAESLAAAWRPGTVFVASSDFTHYGRDFGYVPFPVDRHISERLRDLDQECMDAAGSLDSPLFLKSLAETGATVCGADPIALLLETVRRIAPDDLWQVTLDYQTSGEITGDYSHSVSYAALGYYRSAALQLNPHDREALLASAEETLRGANQNEGAPKPPREGSAALRARRGLFVTLHRGKELLGCIGNCTGRAALADAVSELALAAAFDDPRFLPGAALSGPVQVEISVLSPLRRISSASQLVPGRHGGVLQLGGRAGLLLPQVAARTGWTAERFLRALAEKSELPPDAWRDPHARLYIFEAQVFSRARGLAAEA